jgi:hypothetical protein
VEVQKLIEKNKRFKLQNLIEESVEYIVRILQFNKWMLTAVLAVLGFYFTFLLQIKYGTELPYKLLAVLTLSFLILSIVSGFYFRFCYESWNLLSRTRKTIKEAIYLFVNLRSNDILPGENTELKGSFLERIDLILKPHQFSLLSAQGIILISTQSIALVLGIVSTILYIFLYLFVN